MNTSALKSWSSNLEELRGFWAQLYNLSEEERRRRMLSGEGLPFKLTEETECSYVCEGSRCDLGLAARMVIIRHALTQGGEKPIASPALVKAISVQYRREMGPQFFNNIFTWGRADEKLTKFALVREHAKGIALSLRPLGFPGEDAQLLERPFESPNAVDEYLAWITAGPLHALEFMYPDPTVPAPAEHPELTTWLNSLVKAVTDPSSEAHRLINVAREEMWQSLTAVANQLCRQLLGKVRLPICYIPLAKSSHPAQPPIDCPAVLAILRAFARRTTQHRVESLDREAQLDAAEFDQALLEVRKTMLQRPAIYIFDGYAAPTGPNETIKSVIRNDDIMPIIMSMTEPYMAGDVGVVDYGLFNRNRIIILSDKELEHYGRSDGFLNTVGVNTFRLPPPREAWLHVLQRLNLRHAEEINDLQQRVGELRENRYRSENLYRLLDSLLAVLGLQSVEPFVIDAQKRAAELESLRQKLRQAAGGGEDNLKMMKRRVLEQLYRALEPCPTWQRMLEFIAASPSGVRPESVRRLISEWHRLQRCERLKLTKPITADDIAGLDTELLTRTLPQLLTLRKKDYMYGLDNSPHPWEYPEGAVIPRQQAEASPAISIDFTMPEVRDLLLQAIHAAHSTQSSKALLLATHSSLAEESIRQQTIVLRHCGDISLSSIHGYRRLIQALYHGLLALPTVAEYAAAENEAQREGAGKLTLLQWLDPFSTLHSKPADAWRWLSMFLYRRVLEAAPTWQLSRAFGADRLKLELLKLMSTPAAYREWQPSEAPAGIELIPRPARDERVLAEWSLEHEVSMGHASYSLKRDIIEQTFGEDSRNIKRHIDVLLLNEEFVAARAVARKVIETLAGDQCGLLMQHLVDSREVFFKIFAESNFAGVEKHDELIRPLETHAKMRALLVAGALPQAKALASVLNRLAESAALAAGLQQAQLADGDARGPGMQPIIDSTVEAFACFRLARILRQELSKLSALDTGYLDSGHAMRSCIRTALKLERWSRRYAPDHDPTKGNWGFFAQRARRNADALTHHLFRFPRERASMLIIESSLARILAGSSDERAALRAARDYLSKADVIIQTLDTDARIRMRFRLERSKVNMQLASAVGRLADAAETSPTDNERQYLLMASEDARMLSTEAKTHNSTLWGCLAKRQEQRIAQALKELGERRRRRHQDAGSDPGEEPSIPGVPSVPRDMRH